MSGVAKLSTNFMGVLLYWPCQFPRVYNTSPRNGFGGSFHAGSGVWESTPAVTEISDYLVVLSLRKKLPLSLLERPVGTFFLTIV